MYKIAIVILHYENVDDTLECIESLNKQQGKEFDIVVVDNGSKIGKLDSIRLLSLSENRIHFIRSDENLGFAKGNNIGFDFAKKKLGADIIILANNDLIFAQKDFVRKIEELYLETKYDVAGPKIISLVDGMNQNPVSRMFYSKLDVKKRYIKTLILYILNFVGLDLVCKKIFAKSIQEFKYDGIKDFQLYGACLIFGPNYVEKFEGLYPKTFMYAEEDILRYQIEKNNLKMVYLDNVMVEHKEGSSTGTIYKKNKIKRRFFYKWSLHSLRHLLKIMN